MCRCFVDYWRDRHHRFRLGATWPYALSSYGMPTRQKRAVALALCVILLPVEIPAQPPTSAKKLVLSIDTIMRGPGLVGYEPSEVRWSGDTERVYFRWKQAGDPVEKDPDTYVVNRNGSGLRKLSDQEAAHAPPMTGDRSRDRKRIVYARNGDIYLYDYTTDRGRQITKTADIESNPHFTRDGNRLYFTRSDNLYVMSLDDG